MKRGETCGCVVCKVLFCDTCVQEFDMVNGEPWFICNHCATRPEFKCQRCKVEAIFPKDRIICGECGKMVCYSCFKAREVNGERFVYCKECYQAGPWYTPLDGIREKEVRETTGATASRTNVSHAASEEEDERAVSEVLKRIKAADQSFQYFCPGCGLGSDLDGLTVVDVIRYCPGCGRYLISEMMLKTMERQLEKEGQKTSAR